MKSLATLVLLMTLGVFAIGCEAKKEKAPAGGEGGAAPATEPAPGGEEKK